MITLFCAIILPVPTAVPKTPPVMVNAFAIVWLRPCKSTIPPEIDTEPVESAPEVPAVKTPLFKFKPPENVFTPNNARVPGPDTVSPADPEMTPPTVRVLLFTVIPKFARPESSVTLPVPTLRAFGPLKAKLPDQT